MGDSSDVDLRTPRDSGGPAPSLTRPSDELRRTLRTVASVLAGLAVVVAASTGTAAALTQPATVHDPHLAGLFVALAVLVVCWSLLGVLVACWSRYLNTLDRSRWASDWARVEPTWSGRY